MGNVDTRSHAICASGHSIVRLYQSVHEDNPGQSQLTIAAGNRNIIMTSSELPGSFVQIS